MQNGGRPRSPQTASETKGVGHSISSSSVTVTTATVSRAPGRLETATRTVTTHHRITSSPVVSSELNSRSAVEHNFNSSSQSNHEEDNEPVRLRHAPTFDKGDGTSSFGTNDSIGEQSIALRMKEEERQFDRRTRYQSVFKEVPLYQSYSKEVIRRESCRAAREGRYLGSDRTHTDLPEDLRALNQIFNDLDIPAIDESPSQSLLEDGSGDYARHSSHSSRPPSCRLSEEPPADTCATPEAEGSNSEGLTRMLAGSGPQRTTWAAMPEVQQSGVLEKLSDHERNLQELLFEVITSEASYYRSLQVLVQEFYKAPEFDPTEKPSILTALQKVHLFSNILQINEMSENFLHDLEGLWQKSPTELSNVTKVIHEHAKEHFKDYVPYIRNQIYMNKALAQLDTDERFKEAVRNIQKKAECGHIWDFRSFILLPMQRVTRLKLLVGNILHMMSKANISEEDPRYQQSVNALNALVVVLQDAETQQDLMTQKEHLLTLINQLDWSVKLISISGKTLVREGKLRLLSAEKSMNYFKKRSFFSSKPIFVSLFLFNDLLLVAKMKTNGRYVVIDHCPRAALSAQPLPSESHPNCKFPFALELLENHVKSKERLEMDAETSTEQERWLSVLCPSLKKEDGEDCVYDEWDRPKVLVTHEYNASQPDELNLKEGELYSVTKKTADGWYHGTSTSGKSGWFPVSCTVEKEDDHVRYRILRNLALASSRTSLASAGSSSSVYRRRPSAPRGYTVPPEPPGQQETRQA